MHLKTSLKLRVSALALLLASATPAFAAEPVPGGACTTLNYIVETGGPETTGVRNILRCDGALWQQEMTIDAAGNVGIGTATPTASLHVIRPAENVGDTYPARFTGNPSGAGQGVTIGVYNNGSSHQAQIQFQGVWFMGNSSVADTTDDFFIYNNADGKRPFTISPNDTVNLNAAFALTSDITPGQITANQNDYNPATLSTASVLRLSSDASRNITSLAGGADGRVITIMNVGTNPIVLKNDDGSTGTAANRFALTGDLTLAAKQSAILMYDLTSSRWRQIANSIDSGGGSTSIDSLTDAMTDYTTDHNMRLGSNTAPVAGAINNVFVGEGAGATGTNSADYNTALGYSALNSNTSGTSNTAVGTFALRNATSGDYNVALGMNALGSAAVTGSSNTALGAGTLYYTTTGGFNIAIGRDAMLYNDAGSGNIAVGFETLWGAHTSANNVAIGYEAARQIIGNDNVVIGNDAGHNNTDATVGKNVIIGALAGGSIATGGDNNTMVGWGAGGTTTTGANNILVGYNIQASAATASNQLNIGNAVYATGLGSAPLIGIGTATPHSLLQVNGGVQIADDTGTCPGASNIKLGTLRYATDKIQYCKTTGWVDVASAGGTNADFGAYATKTIGTVYAATAGGIITAWGTRNTGTCTLTGLVDGNNPPTTTVAKSATTAASQTAFVSFAVKSGDNYEVTQSNCTSAPTGMYYTPLSGGGGGSGDNLGNHIATQNIQLGSNWLSGDGGSEGIRVDNSGMVGINMVPSGTASLELKPTLTIDGAYVNHLGTGATAGSLWGFFTQDSGSGAMLFGHSSTTYTTGGTIGWVGDNHSLLYYPDELRIGTGVGAIPVMTMTSAGQVGIGTTTPSDSAQLEVKRTAPGGGDGIVSAVFSTDFGGTGTGNQNAILLNNINGNGSHTNYVGFATNDAYDWFMQSDCASNGGLTFCLWNGFSNILPFYADANSKVGIGFSTPGGTVHHALDVNGNIGLAASGYLNFGATDGSGGYGLRDNGGSVEVKASTGSWATVPGYSSGTFTPTYAGTTTAGSCTYTSQLGSYVQVGKLVTFSIRIGWSACGTAPAGAPFLIKGLPVASLNTASLYQSVGNVLVTTAYSITANDIFVARIPSNSTQIELKQAPANNASTVLADVLVDSAADITISGSYIAN